MSLLLDHAQLPQLTWYRSDIGLILEQFIKSTRVSLPGAFTESGSDMQESQRDREQLRAGNLQDELTELRTTVRIFSLPQSAVPLKLILADITDDREGQPHLRTDEEC